MADRFARATGNWADTSTWSATASGSVGASVPGASDSAIINVANKVGGAGALTITLTGDVEVDGLELYGTSSHDATLHTASEHTVTINNYGIGGYSAKIHGYTELTGNVNLTFTRAGAHTIIIDPTHQTNKVNDITVNHASNVLLCGGNVDIKGDLTVTAGTYNTNSAADGSGTDYALTVDGDVLIGESSGSGDNAVLTGNASEIIIHGGMKIDVTGKYDATTHANGTVINKYLAGGGVYALQLIAGGTFIHNDGLVHVTGTGGYSIVIEGLSGSDVSGTDANALHDLKVTLNSISNFVKLDPVPSSNGDTMIITGDLDIVEGKVHGNSVSDNLTVNGDVTVRDGAQLSESTSVSGAMTFGSLDIQSGGTYIATSGTTTVKSRTSGGYSWYAPTTGSTFTHNNGTVKFTVEDWGGANETYVQGTNFYNLEFAADTAAMEFRYDDLTDNSGLTVLNNLTITDGKVRFNQGGDSVTVHGITKMVAGQYGNTGTAPSGVHNYNGGVEIHAGTWKVTSGTCNMQSIRKLGGTLA